MSIGLGLDETWFDDNLTAEPLVLFRIFHYPPLDRVDERWSVGEHTDYGLITILAQDTFGRTRGARAGRLDRGAPGRRRLRRQPRRHARAHDRRPVPLDAPPCAQRQRRSTACRSRCSSIPVGTPRCSPCRSPAATRPRETLGERWDGADVHAWSGTYGEYVVTKVGRVFPALRDEVLPAE